MRTFKKKKLEREKIKRKNEKNWLSMGLANTSALPFPIFCRGFKEKNMKKLNKILSHVKVSGRPTHHL